MSGYARAIERQRSALVEAMLARIPRPCVGDEVLATYLIDGFARRVRGEPLQRVAAVRVSAADVPGRLGAELSRRLRDLDPRAASGADEAVRALLHELPWSSEAPDFAAAGGESHAAQSDALDAAIAERVAHLDLVDPVSGDHARAVGAWCRRIAQRLGLDDDAVLHAERAGLLHDIGKADVPRELLTAPRALDAPERAAMEEHVLLGERCLLAHPALRAFASTARSHHERFDGRGYPDGLAGEAIPRAARIAGVAGAFNAMIDRRPYRTPRAPAEALLELHKERGSQFDPKVVDAAIAVVEQHA